MTHIMGTYCNIVCSDKGLKQPKCPTIGIKLINYNANNKCYLAIKRIRKFLCIICSNVLCIICSKCSVKYVCLHVYTYITYTFNKQGKDYPPPFVCRHIENISVL